MKRRTMLKRIGAGGLLALSGVQAASAAPSGASGTVIRFGDDREDVPLAEFDPATADFSLEDCCTACDGKCFSLCECCLCE